MFETKLELWRLILHAAIHCVPSSGQRELWHSWNDWWVYSQSTRRLCQRNSFSLELHMLPLSMRPVPMSPTSTSPPMVATMRVMYRLFEIRRSQRSNSRPAESTDTI